MVPPPGFLSEPKQGNVRPPPTSGGKPSFAPEKEKQPKKNPASTFNAHEKVKQPNKNPASAFNVQDCAAPVTPPYNPPDREPKATPRKREKKQEPGRASTDQPPALEKSADEMLDKELRKTNAQSSTDQPTEVDLERLFVDAYQATGAELLQQSGMAESTETFDTSDPLTPFLAYVLFVLHYRNNPFPDSWLIFKHSEMREIRDRKRAVLAYCRPWSTISHSEIDDVCLELLSLFEEAPRPESMNSGVFRTFAKALISAKGEGERRESVREHDFSVEKKKGRKAGAAGGQKEACSTEARVILFTPGAAQGSLVAGWRGPPEGGAVRRVSRAAGGQGMLQAVEICATALADVSQ